MSSGHPVVWLWLVGLAVLIAGSNQGLLPVIALGTALTICGLLAHSPRNASFVAGLIGALACTALWFLWTVLSPGTSLVFWLAGSASAAAVCLALGVAGQLVSTRQWLSLAAVTGPLAPAFGWLCGMGEACAEVAERRRQQHRAGRGLRAWIATLAALSDGVAGVSVKSLSRLAPGHLFQGAATATLTVCWAAYDALGPVPLVAAATLLPVSVAFSRTAPAKAVPVHG